MKQIPILLLLVFCYGCQDSKQKQEKNLNTSVVEKPQAIAPKPERKEQITSSAIEAQEETFALSEFSDNTIASRIIAPENYERKGLEPYSFQHYLRSLPLKPEGSLVTYFDGSTKTNNQVYTDVIDLAIGNKDLHQCADAVMRLKAEYLWKQKRYNEIHFNFTNGHKVAYSEWMKGKRMAVDGNKTRWVSGGSPSNTYNDFWDYMELIFMYAGTASLEKEMDQIEISQADIGDVLIRGGHPGHAVIIVDKAIHKENGQAIFLLAQSYMPAQELQILHNIVDTDLSPWYTFQEGQIDTPEWTFFPNQLRRFQ